MTLEVARSKSAPLVKLVDYASGRDLQLLDFVTLFLQEIDHAVCAAEVARPHNDRRRNSALDQADDLGNPAQVAIIEQAQFRPQVLISITLASASIGPVLPSFQPAHVALKASRRLSPRTNESSKISSASMSDIPRRTSTCCSAVSSPARPLPMRLA